jgi:hypothetical protein
MLRDGGQLWLRAGPLRGEPGLRQPPESAHGGVAGDGGVKGKVLCNVSFSGNRSTFARNHWADRTLA